MGHDSKSILKEFDEENFSIYRFADIFTGSDSVFLSRYKVKFDNRLYSLAYSAKPVPNLFTQEYLLPGEKLESFSYMLSLNTLKFEATIEQAVEQKINDLNKMKEKGLKVAYKKGSLANEIYLDITIFSNLNGTPTAEHSIYRYTKQGGNLVLFTIQRRAYKRGHSKIYYKFHDRSG